MCRISYGLIKVIPDGSPRLMLGYPSPDKDYGRLLPSSYRSLLNLQVAQDSGCQRIIYTHGPYIAFTVRVLIVCIVENFRE